jgi:alkylation response protein AidB-like acyl-CoA dehydrogenase
MKLLEFAPPIDSAEAEALRAEVRAFLAVELTPAMRDDTSGTLGGVNPEFSRKVGRRGWLGMTWPKRYGGHERTALERYVVLEEMLAAGAPINAHYIAERQSGPLILRFGTEQQRMNLLPRIAAGECYICIGMSEPGSGSDLASVRTRATPTSDGFRLDGRKAWTSYVQHSHYILVLCRTRPADETDRGAGLSQFLVDTNTPGVSYTPVANLAGEHHFNEVVFDNVQLPPDALIGELHNGWKQLTSELALERSGPDRFLTAFRLLREVTRAIGPNPSERAAIALGRLTSHILVLRQMSRAIAGMIDAGEAPALQGAIVKDLGTTLEQELPEIVRLLMPVEPSLDAEDDLESVLANVIMHAPSFSIRGGTREILRSTIARSLGLR